MKSTRPWYARACLLALVAVALAASVGAGKKTAAKPRRAVVAARLPEAVTKKPPGKVMDVALIDRTARPAVRAAAGRIDALLEKHWQEHGIKPSRPLDDAGFARRVKDRSANGTSASVGRVGQIMRSNRRDGSGWMRPDRGGAEELPIRAQGRIFPLGADRP